MAVRYETYCGGRLLRIIEQVDVSDVLTPPDARQYVDGSWTWEADRQRIAPDIAQAMLADAGETVRPGPAEPLIITGQEGTLTADRADVRAVYDVYRQVMEEEGMRMLGWDELEPAIRAAFTAIARLAVKPRGG